MINSACGPVFSLTLVYNLKKQPQSRTHQSHGRECPGSLQILTMAAEALAGTVTQPLLFLPIAPNMPVVMSRENRMSVLSSEDISTCHKTMDKQVEACREAGQIHGQKACPSNP